MKTRMLQHRTARFARRFTIVATACGVAAAAACDQASKILDVVDPDVIAPEQVNDSAGAEALRIGALARFNGATSGVSANAIGGTEGLFILGGTLADELRSSDTFVQRDEIDARGVQTNNANLNTAIRDAHRARLSAAQATRALFKYAPSRRAQAAEMLMVQSYMENLLAETLCSGLTFSDFVDGVEQLGNRNTTGGGAEPCARARRLGADVRVRHRRVLGVGAERGRRDEGPHPAEPGAVRGCGNGRRRRAHCVPAPAGAVADEPRQRGVVVDQQQPPLHGRRP
jgi:hypothetical protein